MTNTILTITSHPDDETFGCGATLAKHTQTDTNVETLCLTCNPENRKPEYMKATTILKTIPTIWMEPTIQNTPQLIHKIADKINQTRPTIIITHIPTDYHQEHRTCYQTVKEAIEWAAHTTMYPDAWQVKRLLLMEVNTLIPQPTLLIDTTETHTQKMEAIKQYTSQLEKFPWGYYETYSQKKAELRGAQCNTKYAEAFIEETLPQNSPFYPEKNTKYLI